MQNEIDDKKFQKWLAQQWRPTMAYVYMFICIFDFVIAPVLWSVAQSLQGTKLTEAWVPLTLQGAGLFHAAMGAILGVSAWGRSQEKLAYINGPQVKYQPGQNIERPPKGGVYGREE